MERIGTISVGYADGFRRNAPHEVLVRGVRVPVVGQVCMDYSLIQLDKVPTAESGDEVVILGTQGTERITAEETATRWHTINYDVVSGIRSRVERVYA